MINKDNNRFYIGNINEPDAEITFTETEVIAIDHTYVKNSLRGKGVAELLLQEVIKYAKEKNKKILPICSYAKVKLADDKYKELVVSNSN